MHPISQQDNRMKTKPTISAGFMHFETTRQEMPQEKQFDLNAFPLLPTRSFVLFPSVAGPITIGRPDSLATVRKAEELHHPIAIFCQKDQSVDNPSVDDLHSVGVIAQVIKVLELPDGSHTALVAALDKCVLHGESPEVSDNGFPMLGVISPAKDSMPRVATTKQQLEMLAAEIKNTTIKLLERSTDGESHIELLMNLRNAEAPAEMINLVSTHFPATSDTKIELLRQSSMLNRAKMLLGELVKQEQMMEIARKVQETAKESFDEQQRRAFLQRQMEAIDQELNGDESDAAVLARKSESIALPESVRLTFDKELMKLNRFNPQSPEYAVQCGYLETLLDLPWGTYTTLDTTLPEASAKLDAEHYGLKKVKERIVEQVALILNNPEGKSPIICLVGPPGVGKTSLGKSIADALGRKFQRISLGGLHDEAEIRGHRRTYIGAMPGRIIEAIRRGGSSNPVLMLDEIDKIGKDYKGDPEAALLEVLDPEQNLHFHDNYIDVDYDLSKVLFIATANNVSGLSRPLLDRMEVIDLSGYILEEKIEIARRHILPKALKELSLPAEDFAISNESLAAIVDGYTSESGVRQLENVLRSLIRKVIVRRLSSISYPKPITPNDLTDLLGPKTYIKERYIDNRYPGVVTGLAWTSAGGEILFIESSIAPSKSEKLTLTGNLGDVMKESATIALQYIRAHAIELGIDPARFESSLLHIHVPEGAIPKDGPSAGITMATSILSAFTGRLVKERLAMTGELTLRGKVLPVGGIKEKILAAKRAGITEIIMSEENRKDIDEIESQYLSGLKFNFVTDINQVFELAILHN